MVASQRQYWMLSRLPWVGVETFKIGTPKSRRKETHRETYLECQNIFHLPGEMLSSTTIVNPEIRLEPAPSP